MPLQRKMQASRWGVELKLLVVGEEHAAGRNDVAPVHRRSTSKKKKREMPWPGRIEKALVELQ